MNFDNYYVIEIKYCLSKDKSPEAFISNHLKPPPSLWIWWEVF
ncbi:hypothetical protein HMPREF1568_1274 [Providencia alcalifaciens PAL-3]|nr:hypothetical protein HMPREF1568_1274 [Providencia alcalifaciens PAL-3]EUD00148.1 hypothetical protein HMPREF1566_2091 [Providencia alcalifaciens PAL-1]